MGEVWKESLLQQATAWKTQRDFLILEQTKSLEQQKVIAKRLAEMSSELQILDKNLVAAATLAPELEEQLQDVLVPEEPALTDAIVKVLQQKPEGVDREYIRGRLPVVGYATAKLDKNPNYLYIALKRLINRRRIEENEGKFRILK